MLSENDIRELVRLRAKQYAVTKKGAPRKGSTGITNWCRVHSVSKSHASLFMRGKSGPCQDLLDAIGVVKCFTFKENMR
jgi:hypothetical protein